MRTVFIFAAAMAALTATAHAYQINGFYAELVACEFGYSQVRGENGYTGTYNVMGELFTVYFGGNYCPA